MTKLLSIYFSGTGNTAYAVNRFCARFKEAGITVKICNIENISLGEATMFNADTVLTAYPIYGSDMPRILKEFIALNPALFQDKDLITLVTQQSFSGDGGSVAARFIKRHRSHKASVHIDLPSNITDTAVIGKTKPEDIKEIFAKAGEKIDRAAADIINGKRVKDGAGILCRIAGGFQRVPFNLLFVRRLRKGLKIDAERCNLCGKCAVCCPMKNIIADNDNMYTRDNCTLCYRCVNLCPKQAISLMSGRKPAAQYKAEASVGPFYSGKNMAAIDGAFERIEQGKAVVKTIEELEVMENE